MKIAIFYHGLFFTGTLPELNATAMHIVCEQMDMMHASGLLSEASELLVGLNGGMETGNIANLLIPSKAKIALHGLQSKSENLTIAWMESFVKAIPEGEEWYILYTHAKGATWPINDPMRAPWRACMNHHLITNWRQCVSDLHVYESVGCHWCIPPKTPDTQYYWAGNSWWARSSFLKTLPSIYERQRIKDSGIDSLESRFEAEVYIGNGARRPTVKDYCPDWWVGKPHKYFSYP